MCCFCTDTGNGGGKIIISQGKREKWFPMCNYCNSKYQLHGIDICQNCGNVYIRNDGIYIVKYIDYCEQCRSKKLHLSLGVGAGLNV